MYQPWTIGKSVGVKRRPHLKNVRARMEQAQGSFAGEKPATS